MMIKTKNSLKILFFIVSCWASIPVKSQPLRAIPDVGILSSGTIEFTSDQN